MLLEPAPRSAPRPGAVNLPAGRGLPWGWNDYPYGISWGLQLSALLRDHAVDRPSRSGCDIESPADEAGSALRARADGRYRR
jgi:hypothetical protein